MNKLQSLKSGIMEWKRRLIWSQNIELGSSLQYHLTKLFQVSMGIQNQVTKLNSNGWVFKYKARLVVKGFAQHSSIDYGDTFAPVVRHDTIKLLVALSVKMDWKLYHLDLKWTFLNGLQQEEIFVDQHQGFHVSDYANLVYKLKKKKKKALSRHKQAPRAWYTIIDSYLVSNGFKRSDMEATLFVKSFDDGDQLIISIYVDDLLVTSENT